MNLVIVESPNKCSKIGSYLGSDFKVVASVGHVRDLPRKGLGIDIANDFAMEYSFIPDAKVNDRTFDGGEKRIEKIKAFLNKADKIYLATDPDREGEAISWHLKECLGLEDGQFERIEFNEISEKAIKEAINNGRGLDYQLVYAQEARRALDRLVGYLVSPIASNLMGQPSSAGRVQSPAVLIVVLREIEIQKFKVTNHFGVNLSFDKEPKKWISQWVTTEFVTEDQPYVLDRSLAEEVAKTKKVKVLNCTEKTEYSNAPSPFSTALLLQAASVALGFSPQQTTKAAQALFEQGAITYIRTDGLNIADESVEEIFAYANEHQFSLPEKPNKLKEKDGAQNAHEAIRPVHITDKDLGKSPEQKALYQLIWERTISSQLAKAEYKAVTLELLSEDGKYKFHAKSRELIKKGWMVFGKDCLNEDENEPSGVVPVLEVGSVVDVESGEVIAKQTKPPKRYTEASLIKKLESCGIGRPSTYSSIMANILNKGFLEVEKKVLKPTKLGNDLICSLLKAKFSFLDLHYSKEMELQLDKIASGETSYNSVVSALYTQLAQELSTASKLTAINAIPCPKCKSQLKKFKNTKTNQFFWICSNEDCKHSMDDDKGKPVEKVIHSCPKCKTGRLNKFQNSQTKEFFWICNDQECKHSMDDKKGQPVEKIKYPCPKCSTPLFRSKKEGKDPIWFCPNRETDCKVFLPEVNKKPLLEVYSCPQCASDLRRINGANGYFWGCTNYKNGCSATYPDQKGKPKFEVKK